MASRFWPNAAAEVSNRRQISRELGLAGMLWRLVEGPGGQLVSQVDQLLGPVHLESALPWPVAWMSKTDCSEL